MMSLFTDHFMHWWGILVPVFLICLHGGALLSAWHAIRNVRTSQAAVAWTVGLVAMPIFTLPIYWVFARNRFSGYREAVRRVGRQHLDAFEAIRRESLTALNTRTTSLVSPLEQVADTLDTPICEGSHFELLVDGDAFFNAMHEQIASAKHYIYAEFYILRDDKIGNRFADALIAAAGSGKTVRLIYDEIGSIRLSRSFCQRLTDAGVDIRPFNTRQGWVNRFQLNFRNHRKLLVVDGERALVGGLNIGDEYVGDCHWTTRWRDTAVKMQGPIVKKIQATFAADYYWASRQGLPESDWEHCDASVSPENGQAVPTGRSALCATGPADHRARATMMFAAAALSARDRLWISTPYLVPDDTTFTCLSMARARGVDVRVLLPNQSDQWLVYLAGFHFEKELKALGIGVSRYTDGFLHQKCVLVDEHLALIGSTNLDNRSLHLNFELMLAVEEREFVKGVAAMLEQDFAKGIEWETGHRPLRPWYGRVGTVLARLFSPVL